MRKIRELYYYVSKKGLLETLLRLRDKYFKVNTFILYERELNDDFNGIKLDSEYRCVEGTLDMLRDIRKRHESLPREFYLDQTHGGKFFYLIFSGDEVVYIHWLLRKGEYSRFFDIRDEDVIEFNYNITLPAYRGNRLQAKAMNHICEELKKKGYKRALGAVAATNTFSVKSMRRTGLTEFNRVKSRFSLVKKIQIF